MWSFDKVDCSASKIGDIPIQLEDGRIPDLFASHESKVLR